MKARIGAATAVLLLVLAPGLAACGGSAAKTTTSKAAAIRAERHWLAGLKLWHHTTQHALNRISIIFSTEASIVALAQHTSHATGSLKRYEVVLSSCRTTVHGLGPVPPGLELAGRYALLACGNLEKGEKGVEVLVRKLAHGGGLDTLDPLTGAGAQLSLGQAQLTTVMHALRSTPETTT